MKTRIFRVTILVFIVITFLGCVPTNTTNIRAESGDTITAIYNSPDSKGRHPAIIYNHGTFVRKWGYSEAASRGYDVDDFVKALNKEGFVAVAPIRGEGRLVSGSDIMGGPASEWNNAVVEGLDVINSALDFLKKQANVDGHRIGIIGFSEGGNITLWSALEQKDFKAIVLMSPANLGKSSKYYFSRVAPKLYKISAPVFLTLGRSDLPIIIRNCRFTLIPRMKQFNKEIEYKNDYPGDHKWFHKVRNEYWGDIITFLNKKLK